MRCVYIKIDNSVCLELRDTVGSEDWGEMGEQCRKKNGSDTLLNELPALMGQKPK